MKTRPERESEDGGGEKRTERKEKKTEKESGHIVWGPRRTEGPLWPPLCSSSVRCAPETGPPVRRKAEKRGDLGRSPKYRILAPTELATPPRGFIVARIGKHLSGLPLRPLPPLFLSAPSLRTVPLPATAMLLPSPLKKKTARRCTYLGVLNRDVR